MARNTNRRKRLEKLIVQGVLNGYSQIAKACFQTLDIEDNGYFALKVNFIVAVIMIDHLTK